MAYARFGTLGSDVYVYSSEAGIVCSCALPGWRGPFTRRCDALDHLGRHRAAGHRVPDYTVEQLERERAAWGEDVQVEVGFRYFGAAGGECRYCLMTAPRFDARFDDGDRALAHLLQHSVRGHPLPADAQPLVELAREREVEVVRFWLDAGGAPWCLGCCPDPETGRFEDVRLAEEDDDPEHEGAVSHMRSHSHLGDPLDRAAMRYLRKRGIRGDLVKRAQLRPASDDEW